MSADKIHNETEAVKCVLSVNGKKPRFNRRKVYVDECHKICMDCREAKHVSEYSKNRTRYDGLQTVCKSCKSKRSASPKHRKTRKEYAENNREKCNDYKRRWAKNNPEKVKASSRKWERNNPDSVAAKKHRRRALTVGAAGASSPDDIKARLEYHGNKCIYCGSEDRVEIDHMIPLSRGGTNWPSNLAPACKSCNSKKCAKSFWEFSGKKRPRG